MVMICFYVMKNIHELTLLKTFIESLTSLRFSAFCFAVSYTGVSVTTEYSLKASTPLALYLFWNKNTRMWLSASALNKQ